MATNPFYNTVLIVTGAGSGIGREIALQAAPLGPAVIATDINAKTLQETKELALQKNLQIETHLLNVADKEAIATFSDFMIPRLKGRKLILVNNAGVSLSTGYFKDTDLGDFEGLMDINLYGVIRMTKAFYPYFIQQSEGHIVNLSSVFGFAGIAGQAAYCTSKFGVKGFTETLRMELLGTNIHTTVVHPGGIKTNIVRSAFPKSAAITNEIHQKNIEEFDKVAKTTPQKAAALILNAIAKNKARLTIGSDAKAIDFITRFWPVKYTRIFKKQMDKAFTN